MNQLQINLTITLPGTELPACEGHEDALLAERLPAVRAALQSVPGLSITSAQAEIIETAIAG